MKNEKKIPIEGISFQKRNIYSNVSQTVCRESFFKVLYTDTNFLSKLRKGCHEVMVDNCYKSRAALQVKAREVMTSFFGDQHHFGLHHTTSGDRCPEKW